MNDRKENDFRKTFMIPFIGLLGLYLMVSCEPETSRLGVDIFPSADSIFIYKDTLKDFQTQLVSSPPLVTSEQRATASDQRLFLLGSKNDTITGTSKADIVAQMSITTRGIFGEDPYIDSLQLWLYIASVEGDTTQPMHIRIHELTERIYYDSTYYSDYEIEGKYKEEPLVEKDIVPKPGELYEFHITDEDYINRIVAAAQDTIFYSNILFQEAFYGFYITTETVSEGGAIAKFQLANDICGLQFRYLHDSVLIDTAADADFDWYSTNFHEWYSQKVNIFEHDYTGTTIEKYLNYPNAKSPVAYVQGMAGVSLRISMPEIVDYFDSDTLALNAAKLLFYILPDSVSGIQEKDYPDRLMLSRISEDGTFIDMYDYVTASSSLYFGKLLQSNERSAFLDPLYYYNFHIGRHLQSVFSAEIDNSDLIIYVNDPISTSKYIKFWSNYSDDKGSLRLELIYTKI